MHGAKSAPFFESIKLLSKKSITTAVFIKWSKKKYE